MPDESPHATTRRPWALGGILLLLLAILVVGAVLDAEDTSVTLSSYSAKEGGARGLYETVSRLGWPVARRTQPLRGSLDTAVVWVALAPSVPPTSAEVHALLESVRAGAGLLVALTPGESPLADSLGIGARRFATPLLVAGEDWGMDDEAYEVESDDEGGDDGARTDADTAAAAAVAAAAVSDTSGIGSPPDAARSTSATLDTVLAVAAHADVDPGYHRYASRYSGEIYAHLRTARPWPADTVVFLAAERFSGMMRLPLPVAIGLELGRGRIVAVAEPRIFMNDFVRADAGVLPVRMLEWLAPPGERAVVFDEFHHGYGSHASLGRATRRFLGDTAAGRTIVQLLLAAALLVLALGARPLAPAAPERIERRSPIEHVDALAHAYEQVGASRLAARRLARGIRRRRAALGRGGTDADYLREVAERFPALAADVELVLGAMDRPFPPERFARLAPALARIERTLAT